MTKAILYGALMKGVNLAGTNLTDANLQDAKMPGMKPLKSTSFCRTKLPNGKVASVNC